jgi:hypothetical protein
MGIRSGLPLFFDMGQLPFWHWANTTDYLWGVNKMSEFDNLAGGNYPSAPPYVGEAKMARMPNMKERLDLAVVQAEARLKDAQRAREIFQKHPELEELLNIMQRGHF